MGAYSPWWRRLLHHVPGLFCAEARIPSEPTTISVSVADVSAFEQFMARKETRDAFQELHRGQKEPESCGNCRFYLAGYGGGCRRYPQSTAFKKEPTEWCGEWRGKPKGEG